MRHEASAAELGGPRGLDTELPAHAERRRSVYLRAGGCCTYCGRVLSLDEMRLDHDVWGVQWHQVPEASLACACAQCHEDKGRRTREEYRAHRRMLLARQILAGLGGGA